MSSVQVAIVSTPDCHDKVKTLPTLDGPDQSPSDDVSYQDNHTKVDETTDTGVDGSTNGTTKSPSKLQANVMVSTVDGNITHSKEEINAICQQLSPSNHTVAGGAYVMSGASPLKPNVAYQSTDVEDGHLAERYKTELCRSFLTNTECKWGALCKYAHGYSELRSRTYHGKFKTVYCRQYHLHKFCPFGSRCNFIHDEYRIVDQDKVYLVSPCDNIVRVETSYIPRHVVAAAMTGEGGALATGSESTHAEHTAGGEESSAAIDDETTPPTTSKSTPVEGGSDASVSHVESTQPQPQRATKAVDVVAPASQTATTITTTSDSDCGEDDDSTNSSSSSSSPKGRSGKEKSGKEKRSPASNGQPATNLIGTKGKIAVTSQIEVVISSFSPQAFIVGRSIEPGVTLAPANNPSCVYNMERGIPTPSSIVMNNPTKLRESAPPLSAIALSAGTASTQTGASDQSSTGTTTSSSNNSRSTSPSSVSPQPTHEKVLAATPQSYAHAAGSPGMYMYGNTTRPPSSSHGGYHQRYQQHGRNPPHHPSHHVGSTPGHYAASGAPGGAFRGHRHGRHNTRVGTRRFVFDEQSTDSAPLLTATTVTTKTDSSTDDVKKTPPARRSQAAIDSDHEPIAVDIDTDSDESSGSPVILRKTTETLPPRHGTSDTVTGGQLTQRGLSGNPRHGHNHPRHPHSSQHGYPHHHGVQGGGYPVATGYYDGAPSYAQHSRHMQHHHHYQGHQYHHGTGARAYQHHHKVGRYPQRTMPYPTSTPVSGGVPQGETTLPLPPKESREQQTGDEASTESSDDRNTAVKDLPALKTTSSEEGSTENTKTQITELEKVAASPITPVDSSDASGSTTTAAPASESTKEGQTTSTSNTSDGKPVRPPVAAPFYPPSSRGPSISASAAYYSSRGYSNDGYGYPYHHGNGGHRGGYGGGGYAPPHHHHHHSRYPPSGGPRSNTRGHPSYGVAPHYTGMPSPVAPPPTVYAKYPPPESAFKDINAKHTGGDGPVVKAVIAHPSGSGSGNPSNANAPTSSPSPTKASPVQSSDKSTDTSAQKVHSKTSDSEDGVKPTAVFVSEPSP